MAVRVKFFSTGNNFGVEVQDHIQTKIEASYRSCTKLHALPRSHFSDRMDLARTWNRFPNLKDHAVSLLRCIPTERIGVNRYHDHHINTARDRSFRPIRFLLGSSSDQRLARRRRGTTARHKRELGQDPRSQEFDGWWWCDYGRHVLIVAQKITCASVHYHTSFEN
jgi:hypothetical protein